MNYLLIIFAALALIFTGSFLLHSDTKLQSTPQLYEEKVYYSFESWLGQYGKAYKTEEEKAYRLGVYFNNWQQINDLNDMNLGFTSAPNQFMDLTSEEFAAIYLTLVDMNRNTNIEEVELLTPSNDVNWVSQGAVTPIKNQGQCGSCWAFSTTGCLEGVSKIFSGQGLQSFSEQQLVDCSGSYGNQGCNGGWMDYAFEYVIAQGIETEAQYPYTAVQGTCQAPSGGAFKVASYNDVTQGDCNALVEALNTQPISVAVDAQTWQFYSTGIFSMCGTSLDHGVLAVGYVSNSYWLIKNSWGTSWGEQGFIQLAWGNTCGLCNSASYAIWN